MARTYRATIKCLQPGGVLCEPSLHYQTDLATGADEPDPADVADGIWSVIGTTFKAAVSSSTLIQELLVVSEELPPDLAVGASKVINEVGTGATGSPDAPEGMVPVINLHTAVRSRSSRGWLMLPGPLLKGAIDGNFWATGFQSAYNAFAAVLDNSFDLGTVIITHVNPVVYSRTRRQRAQTPYTFKVTSATANHQVRWLKSRLTAP